MDENHYNFIKRPLKLNFKQAQIARPALDKIENYEKPCVRPNTVSLDRSMHTSSSRHPHRRYIKNQLIEIENQIEKSKLQINSFAKRSKPKKRNNRTQSNSQGKQAHFQSTKNESSININQNRDGSFFGINDKEQKAVESLCHMSFNEAGFQPQEHFLSAWTNSYPIKQTNKKQTKKFQGSTNRSITCYPVRYKSIRNELTSQLDSVSKQTDDTIQQHRISSYNFPTQIRRVTSYKHNEPDSEDIQSKFMKDINQQKLMFFRNGIIKHLRKKQNMGRHIVNQQWRTTSNTCIQKYC